MSDFPLSDCLMRDCLMSDYLMSATFDLFFADVGEGLHEARDHHPVGN